MRVLDYYDTKYISGIIDYTFFIFTIISIKVSIVTWIGHR